MPALIIPKKEPVTDTSVNLNINTWQWFVFDYLFEIKRGDSEYIINLEKGNIPYISATSRNNGASYCVKERNNEGNKITLSYDGTIGEAFYQKRDFLLVRK